MSEDVTTWGGKLWAAADLATPMAIRVAATLRLADHIAAAGADGRALAAAVDADHDALGRVLGHLVTAGVLTRTDAGAFGLTAIGEQLRGDHPDGLRPWLDLEGAIGRADLCFVELLHTVRTGEPASPRRFGRPFWDDLSADAALAASFDALMGGRLAADAPVVAAAYPWGALGHVVDVGGGDGQPADRHPPRPRRACAGRCRPRRPGGPRRARHRLGRAGRPGRDARAGSFFDPLPAGAGGYLLSGVLHDWDDEDAARILQRCADAAGTPDGARRGHIADADPRQTPTATCACCATSGAASAPSASCGELAERPASGSARYAGGSRSIVELLPSQ